MKTMSLKLPEALARRVSAAAEKTGTAKSTVVRDALEAYLADDRRTRAGSCLDLAEDLIGSVEGPADLSTNREHLRGFGK